MSKNYTQRAHTTEKGNVFKTESPGFNPDNVTIDEDTKSPRFLSSFVKGGMRRLDPHEKKIYYEHQAKQKEQVRLKEK